MQEDISRHDVAAIFGNVHEKVATLDKAISGFRVTGLFPVNREIFTDHDFAPSSVLKQDQLAQPSTSRDAPDVGVQIDAEPVEDRLVATCARPAAATATRLTLSKRHLSKMSLPEKHLSAGHLSEGHLSA